jgi:hypothetical protein
VILVVAVALAALSVPVAGGSLLRLHSLRLRWPFAIAVSLWIQIMVITVLPSGLPAAASRGLHLVSYVLAAAFLAVNRRIPWLWLVSAGGLCNLVAIGANGGVMPASRAALATAGLLPRASSGTPAFSNSAYRPGQHLRFLGDVFSVPRGWPMANVFSIGDVLIVVGAFLLLHSLCGSRVARAWRPRAGNAELAESHVAEANS